MALRTRKKPEDGYYLYGPPGSDKKYRVPSWVGKNKKKSKNKRGGKIMQGYKAGGKV